MESSHRRPTLFEQMTAVDNGRTTLAAALTLDAILGNANKRPQTPPSNNRTLLEIILDDASNKDRKSWKAFRDKIRLKRPTSAWASSVFVPVSDDNVHSDRSQLSRSGLFRSDPDGSTQADDGGERAPVSDPPVMNSLLQLARRDLVRAWHNPVQLSHDDSADVSMPSDAPPSRSFRPQTNCDDPDPLPSSNTAVNFVDSSDDDDSPLVRHGTRRLAAILAEERALSSREAAEATAAAAGNVPPAAAAEQPVEAVNNVPPVAEEPVRMSLIELLEETTQQMGLMGTSYLISDGYKYEEVGAAEEEQAVEETMGRMEHGCFVCMVRQKGAAFIPCGHTFCRVCSRELWIQRGHCPLCNASIAEILDIF
ncbi:Detected protein of unknown function [Hibiscus syriacus]|uniref:RING-type domain-containing protein n=1 Tax=Hibiscus syriacus TaxID=106335 RepID=A0A6A2ZJB9_HIBSY|nr:uncharacterized protein LOC120143589 [Hibiscus syriacus]KAE8692144.1 Detected protein of unknown function [Hibiscus syriacus]